MRILLFENDAAMAGALADMLTGKGHEVRLARGTNTADMLRERPVDIVITDIFLAETSGLQVVLDVKGCAPEVKVLAVSGTGTTLGIDYLEYALEFGADAVLRKPLNEACLLGVLDSFFGESLDEPEMALA